MLLDVLYIFVCTYFLTKVTTFTEGYVANYLHQYFSKRRYAADDQQIMLQDQELQARIQNLRLQIGILTERNKDLQLEVNTLKNKYCVSLSKVTNFACNDAAGSDLEQVCQQLRAVIGMLPKEEEKVPKPEQPKTGDAWKKYLHAKTINSPLAFPKIVSTEELQKLRGLDLLNSSSD